MENTKKIIRYVYSVGFLLMVFSSFANAASGITYHGRVLRPDGSAITGSVEFRIQIRSPGSNNCLMYEEYQTRPLTNGSFVLSIADGSVTPTFNIGTITQVFDNTQNFSFGGASGCTITPAYNPTSGDGRNLQVYFREGGAGPWEQMPVASVNFVPMALQSVKAENSVKLGGTHDITSILRVENTGTPGTATPLTGLQFTELLALVNGTSTVYGKKYELLGAALTAPAGGQTGQSIRWNGTAWEYFTPSAGSVTSVQGTSGDISVSTVAGVATVGLATVGTVTPGTYGNGTNVAQVTVDSKGRVTGVSNVAITGAAPTGTASGDLTGSYPGPSIAPDAVNSAKIADGSIVGADLNSNIAISTTNTIQGSTLVSTGNVQASGDVSGVNGVFTGNVGAGTMSTRALGISNVGGNTLSLTVPSAAFTNYALQLPSGDGSAGFVLTTNGAGVLSWSAKTTGSITSIGVTAPIQSTGGVTPTLSMNVSNASQDGYLSAADWTTFNNKLGSIANQSITFAKIQDIATQRILGRSTAGSGSVEELTLGSGLSLVGGVLSATGAGSVTNVTASSPLASTGGATPAISISAGTADGQTLRWSTASSDWTKSQLKYTDLVNGVGASPWPASCGAGEALSYSTVSDSFSCVAISVSNLALNTGKVWIGNGSNVATEQTMSGDASISNLGVLTIAPNAVTSSKILDSAVTTSKIATQAVTFARMQNIANNKILGRSTAGSGSPEELTLGSGLSLVGGVLSATGTGGTVTSVSALGPLSVATGTTTPVVSISNGAADGQVLRWSTASSDWTKSKLKYTDLVNGVGASPWPSSCTAGQALTYSTVSDSFSCTTLVGDTSNSIVQNGNTLGAEIIIGSNDANKLSFETNDARAMTINASGDVGIGTTTPGSKLDVKGILRLSGTTSGYNGFQAAATAGSTIWTLPTADGTTGQVLQTNGSGILSWVTSSGGGAVSNTASLANGKIWIGDGSTLAQEHTVSGDASISNTGTITIANNAVTSGKILESAVTTNKVADQAVTFQKMQNINTSRILGRSTASTGAIEQLTLGAGLSLVGGVLNVSDTTDNDVLGGMSCSNGDVARLIGSVWTCDAATSANTASKIVARDSSGDFAANAATLNVLKLNNGGSVVQIQNPAASAYTLTLPSTAGSNGQVLSTNGSGVLSWVASSGGGGLQGGVSSTVTLGAACTGIGSLAKTSGGDLVVCDDAPSNMDGYDCSSVGVGAITFSQNGEMYVCLN